MRLREVNPSNDSVKEERRYIRVRGNEISPPDCSTNGRRKTRKDITARCPVPSSIVLLFFSRVLFDDVGSKSKSISSFYRSIRRNCNKKKRLNEISWLFTSKDEFRNSWTIRSDKRKAWNVLLHRKRERERERKSVILDPYRTSGQYDRNLSFTCTTENKVIRSGFTISSRMKGRTEPREHWRRNAAARSAKTTVSAGSEQPLCDSRFTRARSLFERFWNDAVQLAYSCNFANIFFPSMQRFSTIIQT